MWGEKKTKIVATLSDFRANEEFVRGLFEAGMDVVRINSAHVTEEGAAKIVEAVRRVNPAIPVILDTKGPEIRVTAVADEYGGAIGFQTGERVKVRGTADGEPSTRDTIYFNVATVVRDIAVGARLLIADGELELRVTDKTDEELMCEFVRGGTLRSRKSVNVPGMKIDLPSVTEKDRRFIEWAVKNDVDFIAHSFVRSAGDVHAVQEILDRYDSPIKIISKIENQQGIDNLDEIVEASYGVMVARGDLGVELPAEAIPNAQRRIVERCIAAKRPVIIATQMLYSMVRSPRPTRAEVSDVASAIYERVDAVMLSDETAMGDYPVEAVSTMSRVAREIEKDETHFTPMIDMNMVSVNHEISSYRRFSRSGPNPSTSMQALACSCQAMVAARSPTILSCCSLRFRAARNAGTRNSRGTLSGSASARIRRAFSVEGIPRSLGCIITAMLCSASIRWRLFTRFSRSRPMPNSSCSAMVMHHPVSSATLVRVTSSSSSRLIFFFICFSLPTVKCPAQFFKLLQRHILVPARLYHQVMGRGLQAVPGLFLLPVQLFDPPVKLALVLFKRHSGIVPPLPPAPAAAPGTGSGGSTAG